MNLNDLCVLHIYNYQKVKGTPCTLSQFLSKIKPLALSTCMRHVYIFSAKQLNGNREFLNKWLYSFNHPPKYYKKTDYDFLRGKQAYAFMLNWIVGGLNRKRLFNDTRIIGEVRTIFRAYETSSSIVRQTSWLTNKFYATALMKDGKNLLSWVMSMQCYGANEYIDFIKKACDLCAWTRDFGLLDVINEFDYENFSSRSKMKKHCFERIGEYKEKLAKDHDIFYKRDGGIGFLFNHSIQYINRRRDEINDLESRLKDALSTGFYRIEPRVPALRACTQATFCLKL